MGSKILLTGNALALLVTIAAFLQQLSWPNAGLLIITCLTVTILLHVNSKRVEASIPPALRAISPVLLRSRERQASPTEAQAVQPTPSIPRPASPRQPTPTPAGPTPAISPPPVQAQLRESLGETPTLIEK